MSTIVPTVFFIFIGCMFAAALFATLEIALDPDGEGQTWVIYPAIRNFLRRLK